MSIFYRLLNPAMNCLLRSPAHRIISWRVMSLEYRGRRSGRAFATPVSYYRDGDVVYCFTNGAWWHNFEREHPVVARIAGRSYRGSGLAAPATDEPNVHIMARYFTAVPADAKFYGVRFGEDGRATLDSVRRAAQHMVMIRIRLH